MDGDRPRTLLGPLFRFSGTPRNVATGAPGRSDVQAGVREHADP